MEGKYLCGEEPLRLKITDKAMTDVSQTNTSSLLVITLPLTTNPDSRTLLSAKSSSGIKTLWNEKVTVLHRNNQDSQSLPFQYLIQIAPRIFSDILDFYRFFKVLY